MIIHKCFGLDLGTTNSTASVFNNNKIYYSTEDNSSIKTIPSIFAIRDNNREVCGSIAKQQFYIGNPNSKKSIKREMGKEIIISLGEKKFSPEEISSKIINYCKECLLKKIEKKDNVVYDNVVITVPAYFNLAQKDATRKAAELAGLNVKMLLEEPTSAAINFAIQNDVENGLFFVFDLGGGTFDVSILEKIGNIPSVLATTGNNYLGGDNFDMILARYFLTHLKKMNYNTKDVFVDVNNRKFRLLLNAAEEVKKQLSVNDTYNIFYPNIFHDDSNVDLIIEKFTSKQFNELIKDKVETDIFVECEKALSILKEKYNKDLNDITHILMVGGSTKIPYVKEFIKNKYCITEKLKDITIYEPDLAVSSGAALTAFSMGYMISDEKSNIEIEMNSPFLVDDIVYLSGKLITGDINRVSIFNENFEIIEKIDDECMFILTLNSDKYNENIQFRFYKDDKCICSTKQDDDVIVNIIAPTPIQNEDISIEIMNIEKGINEKDVIISRGFSLPCEVSNLYKTNEYSSSEIRLPVWEGPRHIFNLVIDKLPNNISVGTKIMVKTSVDSISNITLKVEVNGQIINGKYEKVQALDISDLREQELDSIFQKRYNYIENEDEKGEFIKQEAEIKRELDEARANNDMNHYNAVSEKYEKMISKMPAMSLLSLDEFEKIGSYIKDNLSDDLTITAYDVDNLVFHGKRFVQKNNIDEAQKCMDELLSMKNVVEIYSSPKRIYEMAKLSSIQILALATKYIKSPTSKRNNINELNDELNNNSEEILELLNKYDKDSPECIEMKEDAYRLIQLTSKMYTILENVVPEGTEDLSIFKGLVSKV